MSSSRLFASGPLPFPVFSVASSIVEGSSVMLVSLTGEGEGGGTACVAGPIPPSTGGASPPGSRALSRGPVGETHDNTKSGVGPNVWTV